MLATVDMCCSFDSALTLLLTVHCSFGALQFCSLPFCLPTVHPLGPNPALLALSVDPAVSPSPLGSLLGRLIGFGWTASLPFSVGLEGHVRIIKGKGQSPVYFFFFFFLLHQVCLFCSFPPPSSPPPVIALPLSIGINPYCVAVLSIAVYIYLIVSYS